METFRFTRIELTGELDLELSRIGLTPGDQISVEIRENSSSGAAYFNRYHNGFKYECVVYPENYRELSRTEPVTRPLVAGIARDGAKLLREVTAWMDNRTEELNQGKSFTNLLMEYKRQNFPGGPIKISSRKRG